MAVGFKKKTDRNENNMTQMQLARKERLQREQRLAEKAAFEMECADLLKKADVMLSLPKPKISNGFRWEALCQGIMRLAKAAPKRYNWNADWQATGVFRITAMIHR